MHSHDLMALVAAGTSLAFLIAMRGVVTALALVMNDLPAVPVAEAGIAKGAVA